MAATHSTYDRFNITINKMQCNIQRHVFHVMSMQSTATEITKQTVIAIFKIEVATQQSLKVTRITQISMASITQTAIFFICGDNSIQTLETIPHTTSLQHSPSTPHKFPPNSQMMCDMMNDACSYTSLPSKTDHESRVTKFGASFANLSRHSRKARSASFVIYSTRVTVASPTDNDCLSFVTNRKRLARVRLRFVTNRKRLANKTKVRHQPKTTGYSQAKVRHQSTTTA